MTAENVLNRLFIQVITLIRLNQLRVLSLAMIGLRRYSWIIGANGYRRSAVGKFGGAQPASSASDQLSASHEYWELLRPEIR